MNLRQAAALAAVLTFGAATAAFAEVTPAPSASPAAAAQPVPGIPASITNNPYIQSAIQAIGGLFQTTNGNAAHGTVTYFRRFELQLETAPRVYRQIHLHQGTVINPRGTTLRPGMVVSVGGVAQSDGSLNANEITLTP